jgi:DNA helicase-2/ATP-dependent DNA helicase PcrA
MTNSPDGHGAALDLERVLNPEQVSAAIHGDGPQLVLAGRRLGQDAGHHLSHRLAGRGARRRPASIVAVTFTNKAAAEMRERVENLLASLSRCRPSSAPSTASALHPAARYGERLGLRRDFAILDADDQIGLMKKALAAEQVAETRLPAAHVLAAISAAKNRSRRRRATRAPRRATSSKQGGAASTGATRPCCAASGVDFDDMIGSPVRCSRRPEIGDARPPAPQHPAGRRVPGHQPRAARPRARARSAPRQPHRGGRRGPGHLPLARRRPRQHPALRESFPGAVVRKLERNYRSTQTILDAAGDVVRTTQAARGKRLWTDAGARRAVSSTRASDEQDEARWVVRTLRGLRGALRFRHRGAGAHQRADPLARRELLRRRCRTLVGAACASTSAPRSRTCRLPARDAQPARRLLAAAHPQQPPRGIGKGTRSSSSGAPRSSASRCGTSRARRDATSRSARSAKALGAFPSDTSIQRPA